MPVRFKPVAALAALVLALAFAVPAAAQQTPTLGAPETTTEAPPPPETTDSGNGGLETWQQVLIFAAGIILLGGIGFAIVGDARERTRKLSRHSGETAQAGVPHKHSQAAKRRARQKARAAKAARRKNR
jgi:hypothetical protein